jgi:hypothetical protein
VIVQHITIKIGYHCSVSTIAIDFPEPPYPDSRLKSGHSLEKSIRLVRMKFRWLR